MAPNLPVGFLADPAEFLDDNVLGAVLLFDGGGFFDLVGWRLLASLGPHLGLSGGLPARDADHHLADARIRELGDLGRAVRDHTDAGQERRRRADILVQMPGDLFILGTGADPRAEVVCQTGAARLAQ